MARTWIVLLCIGFLFAGCSKEAILERIASPADQAEAQAVIGQLRRHDFAAIEKAVDPAINSPDLHEKLVAMAGLIPAGEPAIARLVGANFVKQGTATTVTTGWEYKFGEQWILINVVMKTQDTAKTLLGVSATPRAESLEESNRFTFAGKSLLAYTVFAAAILAVLLTLLAFVACLRTRPLRRKWLWCVFILVGFGRLSVNWATGEWSLIPIYFQLFSASAFAEFGRPWILSVSLPVGAIWFLCSLPEPPQPPILPETPAL